MELLFGARGGGLGSKKIVMQCGRGGGGGGRGKKSVVGGGGGGGGGGHPFPLWETLAYEGKVETHVLLIKNE